MKRILSVFVPFFLPVFLSAALILCAALFGFTSSGCAPREEGLLGYQSEALSLRLRGTLNGVEFSALITLDGLTEGAPRGFRLELSSPETLDGVVVSRSADGKLSASVGGVDCELDELYVGAAAVYLADAFSISGEARSITVIPGADAGLPDLDRLTRLDFEDYTVYIDASTDLPVRIDGSEWGLSVWVEVER